MSVKYNNLGRMLYNPLYHSNRGKQWTTTEQRYLIDNYVLLGPEEVAMGLERPITSIMTRANELRKKGQMELTATNRKNHTRLRQGELK